MSDDGSPIVFPFYQSQVEDMFGEPDEDGEFAKGYLRVLDFSEFAENFSHVRDYEGNKWKCRIYGNYILNNPLHNAFKLLIARDLADELRTYDGCFNIRPSKSGGFRSMHSWGLAVDFNALRNPYGGPVRFTPQFIKCFSDSGFEAGALWSTPDGMHFQIVWTSMKWITSTNPLRPIPWKGEV